jgi:hypothetical protein
MYIKVYSVLLWANQQRLLLPSPTISVSRTKLLTTGSSTAPTSNAALAGDRG